MAGTVEKYAGDAVLAVFGAPMAQENDAERAVLCALEMHTEFRAVAASVQDRWGVDAAIRVGVDTGEAVSGSWEHSTLQDRVITGDAVNTAARLQTEAGPGEVLVGSETARLTRRRIRYGPSRTLSLKGKARGVLAYPALGIRDVLGERWEQGEFATPLVGRERELGDLSHLWSRAQAWDGQLATIMGDVGVGQEQARFGIRLTASVRRRSISSALVACRIRRQWACRWLTVCSVPYLAFVQPKPKAVPTQKCECPFRVSWCDTHPRPRLKPSTYSAKH